MRTAEPASVAASVRQIRLKRGPPQPRQEAAPDTTPETAPETAIDPIADALRLLKRQAATQDVLRSANAHRGLEERELCQIRHGLARDHSAVHAIGFAAARLHRPRDTRTGSGVETRGGRPRAVTRVAVTHTANPR